MSADSSGKAGNSGGKAGNSGGSDTIQIATGDLQNYIARALENANTSPDNAASVARALTCAEVDGQKGHGLSRVASYVAQARSGKVDGRAVPAMTRPRPASIMIDACSGFAFPAIDLAVKELPAIASKTGIAAAGIARSHHAGALADHVERLADAGLVCIALTNTPKAMAPAGGKSALFGTNPIAFGAPRAGKPALVIDLSLSQVARGKIMLAAQAGESIPLGWALDNTGAPTTDPHAAMSGTLLPVGGTKGAALAMMIEVMAVALTGANYAYEASSFFEAAGSPPGVGQFLIAISPAGFAGADLFAARLEAIASKIEADGDGTNGGARLPGALRQQRRLDAAENGVTVNAELMQVVTQLARD